MRQCALLAPSAAQTCVCRASGTRAVRRRWLRGYASCWVVEGGSREAGRPAGFRDNLNKETVARLDHWQLVADNRSALKQARKNSSR